MKKGTVSMAITTTIRLCIAFCAAATCRAGTLTINDVDGMMASVGASEDKSHGLLRMVDIRPDNPDVERHIVDIFISLPYAKLPISKADRAVDFSARIKCVEYIAKFGVMSADTNVLASVCRRLEELRQLPTQSRLDDLATARKLLLHLCYTQDEINGAEEFNPDGKRMRGALLIHPEFCSVFEDIRHEYDARERYNKDLETYRRKALVILKPTWLRGPDPNAANLRR